MRYNDNFQCKGCGAEVTSKEATYYEACPQCGGRAFVKTHKHRGRVTVDDERFMPPRRDGFLNKKAFQEYMNPTRK